MNRAADLLFEIGTEELPAAYLPSLIDQLAREATALFQAQHLAVQRVESFGTPRRLVLIATGMASTRRKPGEEVRGPSRHVSYDKAGKPTPALLGFLRSQGGRLEQTKIVSSEKGEYVYLAKPPASMPTSQVLTELLPQLVGRLRAPKTMRWDASGVRFARPIRWLVALYGSTPVRCTLGRLTASPFTWVGGPLNPRSARVSSPDSYRLTLKRAGVILEQDARRGVIEQEVARVAREAGGTAAPEMIPPPTGAPEAHAAMRRSRRATPVGGRMTSHGLLEEVTYLVEQPVPLAGRFDPAYLDLPREVLLASMAKYQRVFAIESGGKLLPKFVAILEGKPGKPAAVRAVIERILNARLADSLMFWHDDRKRSLEQMAGALSGVTFHERLGSMADKADRLHKLSAVLEQAWGLSSSEMKELRRACQLAKADLVSTMVKEFPTLQGVMGKSYARLAGEPPSVCRAIEEHYLPLGDKLPQTLIGSALAILDKYDTLSSYFAQGIMPTGDQDPFGLRRAAQGIVEVAWKVHRPLPLNRLLEARAAIPLFLPKATGDPTTVIQETGARITRYLFERLYTFAWPAPKPSVDFIDAVRSSPCQDLVDVMDRIQSLRRLDGKPGLRKAAKVIERTRNILRGAPLRQPQVDPARLAEPPERKLWDVYASNHERVERLAAERSYGEATTLFGELFFEPLHEFFDRVLVNVPDEPLRENRLALMQAINTLYTARIADLSKLTLLQREGTP